MRYVPLFTLDILDPDCFVMNIVTLNCVAYSISSVAETRDRALSFF